MVVRSRCPLLRVSPLLLAAAVLFARPAGGLEKPEGSPVTHEGYFATFPTGLRLAVYQLKGAARVSLGISWLAGSMDDPKGKEGLAHLVEHLTFRRRVVGGSVWQRLLGDGVGFNAFTSRDATVYIETGKPEQLRSLLALEAQRMQDPLAGVTEADFDTEREVVVSELRERRQASAELEAQEALEARLFGDGHPYQRSVGGSEESVRRLTFADVTGFVGRLYRPERAILTIIGPREAKEVAQSAFEQLGPLATGPAGAPASVVPPASRPRIPAPADPPPALLELKGAVGRPVLLVAFAVPGEAEEGRAMARAAAVALRLMLDRQLGDTAARELVSRVDTRYRGHDGHGVVSARIELELGIEPAKVLETVRNGLISLQYGDSDFRARVRVAQWSRDFQLMSTYLALENLDVADLAEFVRATGKQDAIRGRQLQVLSLNQTIETYWHRHFKRARSAAVVVLPDPERAAPVAIGPGLGDRTADAHSEENGAFTPRRPVEELARPPGLDRAVRSRLPSGLSVVLVRRPALPIAEVMLVIRTDLAGRGGRSTMLPDFAMSFSGTWADQRWSHTDRLGAQGYTRPELELVTFLRRGTSSTVPQLLEDVERLTQSFEFGRTSAAMIQSGLRRDQEARLRTPDGLAAQALQAALYPGHPYGHQPTPAEFDALSSDVAERWVDQQLRPEDAVLVVAGDIEPGPALLEKIGGIFSGWKRGRAGQVQAELAPMPAEPRVLLVDRPGAKQTRLAVGLRVPEAARGDRAAALAVARRLGLTLQETLRVDAGTTYGVHASVVDEPYAATLLIETAVDAGVSGEALVRLLAGVEALAQTPLPLVEAERVRWRLAREFSMRFDTVSQVTSALKDVAAHGHPADHWEKLAASIASLTPARIQALAKALLGHEVITVVGDAKVVGPQLVDAGFDFEPVKTPAP